MSQISSFAECHYAECHYAESHYAECHYAECHYAECHYIEYHYAECHYAMCQYAEYHYAECRGTYKITAWSQCYKNVSVINEFWYLAGVFVRKAGEACQGQTL